MKIFKKFSLVAMAMCLCLLPMFAGCDLVVTNMSKYLGQSVATINNEIEINMEDLLDIYSNFGREKFDKSGKPTKEGVEATLDLMVSRKLFLDYCTNKEASGDYFVKLTTKQSNEVWKNVYETINKRISTIEKELRAKDKADLEDTKKDDSDKDKNDKKVYEPYQKKYEYNIYSGVLSKVEEKEQLENESIAPFDTNNKNLTDQEKANSIYKNFRELYWNYTDSKINPLYAGNEISYSDKAFSQYLKRVSQNRFEEDRGYNVTKEFIFMREVMYWYNNEYQNKVFEVYRANYNKKSVLDITTVLEKYDELYKAQMEKFDVDVDDFDKAKKDTAQTIYYEKNPKAWFRVSHILIKFDEDKKKSAETKLKNGAFTQEDYQNEISTIKNEAAVEANKILAELEQKLSGKNPEARYNIFRDLTYKYSMDTNSIGTENDMNIPTDPSKDQMVKPFANSSRDLYNQGQKGAISGLVETEYGYHIIMYLGDYDNIDISLTDSEKMAKLSTTPLSFLSNKTLLDKIIDEIAFDKFNEHQDSVIIQLKSDAKVTYFVDAYKSIYK